MEKELLNFYKKDINMRENLKITKLMEKAYLVGKMEMFMKERCLMEK